MPKYSAICGLAVSALLVTVAVTASCAQEHSGDATPKPGSDAGSEAVRTDASHAGGHDGDSRAPSPPNTGPAGSAADHGGIDLVRPDDGYGNLRRRAAARRSLTAGPPASPGMPGIVKMNIHPVPGGGVSHVEPGRNAVGIATAGASDFGHHPPGAVYHAPASAPGPVGTNAVIGLRTIPHAGHDTPNPAINDGINGTSFGRPVTAGIGGPAKVKSGINGTAIRPKY